MTDAKQGHIYTLHGKKVMAMESGPMPLVYTINHFNLWPLTYYGKVSANDLIPRPMVYFQGGD